MFEQIFFIKKKNDNAEKTSHSIHFGSPILCRSLKTNLPYIIESKIIRKLIIQQYDQTNNNADEDVSNCLMKNDIPAFVFSGYCNSVNQICQTIVNQNTFPKDVAQIIAEYSTLSKIAYENLNETRMVIEDCSNLQFVIESPVLELVIDKSKNCEIRFSSVDRMIRMFDCKNCTLYCNNECTSYRFENCSQIITHVNDFDSRILFLSLLSDRVQCNVYDPSIDKKLIATWSNNNNNNNNDNNNNKKNNDNNNNQDDDASKKIQFFNKKKKKLKFFFFFFHC